jgi:uncharacterized protein (TIGR02996 family)
MPKNRTGGGRGRPAVVEEDRFLQAILADPEDAGIRMVYADWLEERGDPRGEYLRLESALSALPPDDERRGGLETRLQDLRASIDPDWLVILSRSKIDFCDRFFRFRCPKQWERLQLTADPRVRFCRACRKSVYYCQGLAEGLRHAAAGHCVALDPRPVRQPGHPGDACITGLPLRIPGHAGDEAGDAGWPADRGPEARRPWWRFW